MMKPTMQTPWIALSERAYRVLLMLYPAEHRREYGPHMAQVFRDVCRDAYRQRGTCGVLVTWLPVLLDLVITAVEERRKEGIRMSKSTLIHWSGPILIVGGLLHMVAGFGPLQPGSCCNGIYQVVVMMIVPALVLLAIGLAGVHARFAPRINRLGRLGLIVAIAAAPAFVIIFLAGYMGLFYASEVVGTLSFLLPQFGTLLFGVSTIQTAPLPRWNVLPLLVGLLPFLVLLPNSFSERGPLYFLFGVFTLVGLGYGLLGYVVHSDVSRREMAAA